jgi:DNA-binding PadR family transcriptional regulator
MPLPDITTLQFLILAILMDGEHPGRYVRGQLAAEGQRKTTAAFYQLMARMEEAGLVRGRIETKVIDGLTVKERYYTLTGAGVAAYDDFRGFVASRSLLGLQGA